MFSTWRCDVREPHESNTLFPAIAEKYARIDVLVNNAGIMLVASLDAMAKADFEEGMQIHFWASYYDKWRRGPTFDETQKVGSNTSSIGGRVAVPHMAPY